jgi:hypothetical protein
LFYVTLSNGECLEVIHFLDLGEGHSWFMGLGDEGPVDLDPEVLHAVNCHTELFELANA